MYFNNIPITYLPLILPNAPTSISLPISPPLSRFTVLRTKFPPGE